MAKVESENRRRLLRYGIYGIYVVGGTLGVLGAGKMISDVKTGKLDDELRQEQLQSEIDSYRQGIEQQGTEAIIRRLTRSQDFFCAIGDELFKLEGKGESYRGIFNIFPYWGIFSQDLKSAGPENGNHTPKFWEEIVSLGEGVNLPLGYDVSQLIDRLNKHSAYFGILGDEGKREQRIGQLQHSHGYLTAFNFDSAGGRLLVEKERLKLEIDIGIFYLQVLCSAGERRGELASATERLITGWFDDSWLRLSKTPGIKMEETLGMAKASNPFI